VIGDDDISGRVRRDSWIQSLDDSEREYASGGFGQYKDRNRRWCDPCERVRQHSADGDCGIGEACGTRKQVRRTDVGRDRSGYSLCPVISRERERDEDKARRRDDLRE
jgi:hypothetical protein